MAKVTELKATPIIAMLVECVVRGEQYRMTVCHGTVVRMIWRGSEVPSHNIYSHSDALYTASAYYAETIRDES